VVIGQLKYLLQTTAAIFIAQFTMKNSKRSY
jgi:hypothetical protein